jgi:toxin FitB
MAKRSKAHDAPVVLDSSCWLEYLGDTDRADLFAMQIAQPARLIVPVITVYEVYKKLLREMGEAVAHQAVGLMQQGRLIELDLSQALAAASNGLPMADSLIYATAQKHHAILWTQDAHFQGLHGVHYVPK